MVERQFDSHTWKV